jgi:ADP-dependent NAD(P)H-hydrate dehydratase
MRPSPLDEADARPAVPLTAELLSTWPLPLHAGDDKHDRGTVLVIAGSVSTPGAALLAGVAALRAGAGRLQIATVESISAALGSAIPEALVQGVPATAGGAVEPAAAVRLLGDRIGAADALLIGPGLIGLDAARALVAGVLPLIGPEAVVVVDALALMVLRANETRPLSGRLAFTPNREEATSLVSQDLPDLDDGELATRAARDHGATVTLSGQVSSADGRRWVSETAVPGLGTSGSGDVLAGLVAGVAARCGDAAQAACWGTYLHAAGGTRLSERIGRIGYLARELLDEVPGLMDEAMPRFEGSDRP